MIEPPFCIQCEDDEYRVQIEPLPFTWPCIACGKELRHRLRHHFAETFCSLACEDVIYARREVRHERQRRRLEGIACASCGATFRPARRGDATTCSPACRQRLYRKRVTDRSKGRADL